MLWETVSINHLLIELESNRDLKSILREISIDSILDDDPSDNIFPFYIDDDINYNMKAPNILFKFSEEELEKSIQYKHHPIDLYKVVSKNYINSKAKHSNYKIFDYEETWVEKYENNRFNFFLSHRQMGATDLMAFCILHYSIFNSNRNIIAYDDSDLYDKIIYMYESLPFYLKPGVIFKKNRNEIYEILFDNGCRIKVTNIKKDFICGFTYDFILINRLGNGISEFLKNIIPIISWSRNTRLMVRLSSSNKEDFEYFNNDSSLVNRTSFTRSHSLKILLQDDNKDI